MEKTEMAKPLESLITDLVTCSELELPSKLAANLEWARPRGDLYHWIRLLNRFDDIFEHHISKYDLHQDHVKLQIMAPNDQNIVVACLNFTYMLLENCGNRGLYSSNERIFDLVNSPTIAVRLAALEVMVALSERYCYSAGKFPAPKELKNKVVSIFRSYPPPVPSNFQLDKANEDLIILGDSYCYHEPLNMNCHYPPQWTLIHFQYYKFPKQAPPTTPKSKSKSPKKDTKATNNQEGICTFSITSDNIRRLSLEQIYDKAIDVIPRHLWFEFSLQAQVAKAFNTQSYEAVETRAMLLRSKLFALSFLICSSTEEYTWSKIFEPEPYVFSFLADLIQPHILLLKPVYFLAVKTLECISLKRSWGSDLIRNLGGNVSHGILYKCIRHIHKKLVNGDDDCFEKGYIHFFNMVGNLIESKSHTPKLAAGGILRELMTFLVSPTKFRWPFSAAIRLIALFLNHSPDSLNDFVNNNGFQLIIDTVGKEVDFALENPDYDGGAPSGAIVHYTLSFRQANFIRNLMKLVSQLIQSDSGDRLRNLFDSPILLSFAKILNHPNIFGPTILTSTIDSIFYIIHNEPTAFSILNEAGLIETVLDNFDSFFLPNCDLLLSLPEVLGAIALNKEGTKMVEQKNCIASCFKVFRDPALCKELFNSDMATNLGGSFDELGRHYPSFKPIIIDSIHKLFDDVPELINNNLKSVEFFNTAVELSDEDLTVWETSKYSYVCEAVAYFLRSLIQDGNWGDEILRTIKFEQWYKFLRMSNAPYDFITSSYMYNITELLAYFENDDKGYGFPTVCEDLKLFVNEPLLQEFGQFSSTDTSFFDSNKDPEFYTEFLKKLNMLASIISTLASGYFKWDVMPHVRFQQIAEMFGVDDGLSAIKSLSQILSRCLLEENMIRTLSPEDVARTTLPSGESFTSKVPNLRILKGDPSSDKKIKQETSLYKNVLQIRYLCFHVSQGIASIFRYIGNVCMHRRQDFIQYEFRRLAVKLTVTMGEAFNDIFSIQIQNPYYKLCYDLFLSDITSYVLMKKEKGRDIFQTSLVISFLDKGVIRKLETISSENFDKLFHYPEELKDHLQPNKDSNSSNDDNIISDDEGSILQHTVNVLTILFSQLIKDTNIPSLPSTSYFYHAELDSNFNVNEAVFAYIRVITIDLLLFSVDKVFRFKQLPQDVKFNNVPTKVMKNLISIAQDVISKRGLGECKTFVPLDWRYVLPLILQIDYLKSLGLPESKAVHYFKHATDLTILAREEWPCPHTAIENDQLKTVAQGVQNDNKVFNVDQLNVVQCGTRNMFYPFTDYHLVWFNVARFYGDLIDNVAELLCSLSPSPLDHINTTLQQIRKGELSSEEEESFLQSNMILIYKILQSKLKNDHGSPNYDKWITYKDVSLIVIDIFSKNPELINKDYCIYGFEVVQYVLAFATVPEPENTVHSSLRGITCPEYSGKDIISPEYVDKLFETLMKVQKVEEKKAVPVVARLLTSLSKDESYRVRVQKSPLIANLINQSINFASGMHDSNIGGLQSIVTLLRRCFENKDVIRANMSVELNGILDRQGGRHGLVGLLRDSSTLALRDEDIYVDILLKNIRLVNYNGNQLYPSHMNIMRTPKKDKGDVDMEDADKDHVEPQTIDPSIIMHSLVSELISICKTDIFSATEEERKEEKEKDDKSSKKTKSQRMLQIFKKDNFAYACFLLQTLTELLGSYMQCKLEFITYSKKPNFSENVKPRFTALNVLIHQLVPTNNIAGLSGIEYERRSALSSLAKIAILALLSTPVLDENNTVDPKKENPDMTFVRRFFTDIILKAMKDITTSSQNSQLKYGKLVDLFELLGSLISTKFGDVIGPLLNKDATKYDLFFISKSMIDTQIPRQITSIVGGLDLNFPYIDKIMKSSVYPLTLLGKMKVEFQDIFEEKYQDEKDDDIPDLDDDDEDKDDTPDLFKNSTLGMYDVEYNSEDENEYEYYDDEDEFGALMSGEDISDQDSEQGLELQSDMDEDMHEDMDHSGHYHNHHHHHHDIDDAEDDEDDVTDEDDYSSNYSDDDDVEIIDTTRMGDDEIPEYFIDEDDGEEDSNMEGEEGFNDSSEYDEQELDGWIDEFEDGDEDGDEDSVSEDQGLTSARVIGASDDGHHHHHHQNDSMQDFDEMSDEDQMYESEGESIPEEEFDGVGIVPTSRRRARNFASSFFDALRPAMNHGNLANLFGGLFGAQGNEQDGLFSGTIHIGRVPGRDNVPRFDRALDSILEFSSKPSQNNDPLNNLYIKSTIERWRDSLSEYHSLVADKAVCNLVPAVVNNIAEESKALDKEKQESIAKARREKEEKRRKKEEEERELKEKQAREREETIANNPRPQLDPVLVSIGDREVDISGTDIDPEFFEALPDDMREEVLTQHIRERRANAYNEGGDTREIDPDFLEALPEQIREEILQQESMARRYSSIRDEDNSNNDDNDSDSDNEYAGEVDMNPLAPFRALGNVSGLDNIATERRPIDNRSQENKPKRKVFFTPLVDKVGISAIIRLLFVPQPFNKRDHIHQTLKFLCYNKQTRIDVTNLIIAILQDGLQSQKSIEKIYNSITMKILKDTRENNDTKTKITFPVESTPLVIANQMVDLLHFLLEHNHHMRYYILTEHENSYFKNKKNKGKDSLGKVDRYPINSLLKLLDNPLLRENVPFLDILSRILQVSTRPLNSLKKYKSSNDNQKKPPLSSPYIPDYLLRLTVKFLTSNDCLNSTFRRAISAMQNLINLDLAQRILSMELSDLATKLGQSIIEDLNNLSKELKTSDGIESESESINKFNASSSDQAKLLRVLTALDYMFDSKDENKDMDDIEELTGLYKKLALGSLWDALSDCLRILEENKKLSNIATILLPLIEALMVVCKHSKVKELQVKDSVKYEAKRIDFTKEPIESLFFSFTDEHKKILNQMVRTNPNLMSGPFAMLVSNPKVLEFDNKKNYFDRKLHNTNEEPKTLNISIRRDQVFLDSYRALFFKSKEEFRDSKLEVNFKGESGIDAGGVTREWYQVLSRQMFNPDYALFSPVSSDENTYHPNRISYINPEHLSFFKFIGKVIGKAIYDNCFLDCHFSRAVYKRILGRKVSLKDMETLDLEYFKSLMWMLENDITDVITEDFLVETDDYGEKKIIDLIPNGRDIPVTEENKQDYVRLVVEYRLQTSVAEQMDNFLIGFHEIIPKDVVAIFDEQELELLISGLPDIDVTDWQNNTSYNNYSPSSLPIQWFWRAVKSFDNEERAKLLQFATGTSKVPLNGFKELSGANGVCKFSIHRDYGPLDRLPSSHTCFNQIDLPAYESYETLRGSLLLSITEGHEGFGLA